LRDMQCYRPLGLIGGFSPTMLRPCVHFAGMSLLSHPIAAWLPGLGLTPSDLYVLTVLGASCTQDGSLCASHEDANPQMRLFDDYPPASYLMTAYMNMGLYVPQRILSVFMKVQ
jgi:hypothetical protein